MARMRDILKSFKDLGGDEEPSRRKKPEDKDKIRDSRGAGVRWVDMPGLREKLSFEVEVEEGEVKEPQVTEPKVRVEEKSPPELKEGVPALEPDVDQVYEYGRQQIEQVLRAVAANATFDLEGVLKVADMFTKSLRESDRLLFKAIHSKHPEDFLPTHCLNVGILAIRVGLARDYLDKDLMALGLGALVHDIGMVKVPEQILKKDGRPTPEEFELIKRHPQYARDILDRFQNLFPWLPTVVYQEHERENGRGYPQGLRGDEIHPYAKIIGIVDVYEALTHPRVYRDGLVAYRAIQTLMGMKGADFFPQTIKALIDAVSVFPLESLVKLNTGEVGKVIRINRLHPLRPTVEILLDPNGKKPLEPKVIDLEEEPMLYISGPVLE